jgi:hypothetical protein
MNPSGVPFSCPRCRADGWPTGQLVFGTLEPPLCKYHPGVPFDRSRFYTEEGKRTIPRRVEKFSTFYVDGVPKDEDQEGES